MPTLFQRVRSAFGFKSAGPTAREQELLGKLREAHFRNREMAAKIDAAQTTDENKRHWSNADALGPNAALDPLTRAKCRNRSRYETINNGYARAAVRTRAYDLVGTGPRPQLTIPGDEDGSKAKAVERLYAKWAKDSKLGRKLRVLAKSDARDGDGIGILDTNMDSPNPVKLWVRLMESEQLETPWEKLGDPSFSGGIQLNAAGEPEVYWFLRNHPGESRYEPGSPYITARANRVLHVFEQDRAGQVRGIPHGTAGLDLYGQLRRYTKATLTAAEFAAMLAGILKSNLPPGEATTDVESWDLYEMVRGALLTLPQGWEATQFKSENPHSNYSQFKGEILNEAGRGAGLPQNIVTGNSSGYNFSSGRLDHLPYQRHLGVDRDDFRSLALDPTFLAWHEEASQITDFLPADLPPIDEWTWTWNWDGFDSIDQTKDAQADEIRLRSGTTTFKEVYAAYGQDSEEQLDVLEKEVKEWRRRGLKHPLDAAAAAAASPAVDPAQQPPSQDDGADPPEDAPQPKNRLGRYLNGHANGVGGAH